MNSASGIAVTLGCGALLLLGGLLALQPGEAPLPALAYRIPDAVDDTYQTTIFRERGVDVGLVGEHRQGAPNLTALTDTLGGGACVLDVNRDGWMDVWFSLGSGTRRHYGRANWWSTEPGDRLLVNNGLGTGFEDQPALLAGEATGSSGCAVGDLDGDGWQDLITFYGSQIWIRPGGEAGFGVPVSVPQAAAGIVTGAVLLDVDADGDLDIYVPRLVIFEQGMKTLEKFSGFRVSDDMPFDASLYDASGNSLYINEGNFRFVERAKLLGVENAQGRSVSASVIDANEDGLPDLLVANDFGTPNRLFLNRGGTFETAGESYRAVMPAGSRAMVATEDFLLFTRGVGEYPVAIGRNDYAEVSRSLGLASAAWIGLSGWGAAAGDFNGDGHADIFFANGGHRPDPDARLVPVGQANRVLLSSGANGWRSLPALKSQDRFLSSRAVATLDFDNDGALDVLVMNNNASSQLLQNSGTKSRWLGVDLLALNLLPGASVTLLGEGATQFAGARQGFLAQSDTRLLLRPAGKTAGLVVKARGFNKTYRDLPLNTYVSLAADGTWQRVLPAPLPGYAGNPLAPVAALREDLGSSDPALRLAAVAELRQLELDASVDWLVPLLHDEDAGVRCAVAETFAHFFDQEEAAIRRKGLAVKPLVQLVERDVESAACAADALANAENKRAVPALISLFGASAPLRVKQRVARSLGLIRDTAAIAPLDKLISALEPPVVTAAAVVALVRLGQPAEDILARLLELPANTAIAALAEVYASEDSAVVPRHLMSQAWRQLEPAVVGGPAETNLIRIWGYEGDRTRVAEINAKLNAAPEPAALAALARINGRWHASLSGMDTQAIMELLETVPGARLDAALIRASEKAGVPSARLLPHVVKLDKPSLAQFMAGRTGSPAELLPWLEACGESAAAPLGSRDYLELSPQLQQSEAAIRCYLYREGNMTSGRKLASRVLVREAMKGLEAEAQKEFRETLAKYDDFYTRP